MRLFRSSLSDYYDRGMREYPAAIRLGFSLAILILWVFSKLMWRWRVERADLLKPSEATGSVIICNHTSMAEVVVIVAHITMTGRRVRPIMKSEFCSNKLVEWAFSRCGAIPVERGKADMKALRRAAHALQRGEDVLIFPEGTRIRTDDQPVEVHGGFSIIAQMGKAPVVPMAVCGFCDITPNGHRLMRPVRCWLRAGSPVSLREAPQDLRRSQRTQWVEDRAIGTMYELRDQLRAEHPGRR